MKKFLLILLCLVSFLPYSVKALTGVPAAIKDNDSETSLTIEILEGKVIMPEYCSTGKGCTIIANPDVLKSIGKYNFGSGQEYFYIKKETGVKLYKEKGPNPSTKEEYEENYNKMVISAKEFLTSKEVTIAMGSLEEERDIILVATPPTEVEKDSNLGLYIGIGFVVIIGGTILIIKKKQN